MAKNKHPNPFTLQDYAEYKTIKALEQDIPKFSKQLVRELQRTPSLRRDLWKARQGDMKEWAQWVTMWESVMRRKLAQLWLKDIQERWTMQVTKREPKAKR